MLDDSKGILTDLSDRTDITQHEVNLNTSDQIRNKPYQIPYAVREAVRKDIQGMIDMDIKEPPKSPYASSIVVAKTSDGSKRICIDYSNLNKVTILMLNQCPIWKKSWQN